MSAEVFITSLYLYLCRGYISRSLLVQCAAKRLAAAALMFALVRALGGVLGAGPAATFLQVGAGACVYFLFLLLAGDRFLRERIRDILRKKRK